MPSEKQQVEKSYIDDMSSPRKNWLEKRLDGYAYQSVLIFV
jgi:hypothetical protein